jgi:hypothetical protein
MPRHTVQEYLRVPDDWPVREKIRHEIVLMPNKEDIRTAKQKDPRACALHNCACRVFDIPNCAIGGRWAYIPQRDAKGRPYIARMQAPAETQRAIKHFDKTSEMPEGGFRFIPIAESHTYKRKNAYYASRIVKQRLDKITGSARKKRVVKRRMKKPDRAIPRTFAEPK